MSTGLHTRKKHAATAGDPEIPISDHDTSQPPSPTAGFADHDRKYKGRRWIQRFFRSDVGCAVEAVVGFLFFGILLAYLVLHHQHRTVIFHIMSDPIRHAHAALKGRVGFRHHYYSGHPRSVTVLLPSVVNPNQRYRRLDSIFETWGPTARAVYVVHNVSDFPQASPHAILSDHSKPEDPYSYPQLLLVPPEISFDDGVPRLRYVIENVHKKINPDFAFFVNDHTFVIPEHLCKYLEHKHPSEDMYHGHALKNGEDVFNSGASGYILSRETMKKLIQKWDEDNPTCTAKNAEKWLQGNPGLVTTKCLKEVLNIEAVDTRAWSQSTNAKKYHRFHAFPLTRVVSGDVDGWYRNKHEGMEKMMDTDESYGTLLDGPDCCSYDTISFHYVEYKESRALFATRDALLKNPRMSDPELKALMTAEFPHENKEIGGYSRKLPKEDDVEGWKKLIQTMRKISTRQTQREC